LFGALTFFRSVPILSDIRTLFLASFGWSTYLLALGLIAFAVAHLIEGILNKRFMRLSLIIGLVLLWLLVLAESRLLLGGMTGGVVAALLVYPLLGWPAAVGHILLIGLFLIVAIVTFRITFGHVLLVGRTIGRVVSSGQKKGTASTSSGLSPFLGQRPRFSRYGNGLAGTASPNRPEDQQEQDDEDLIDFEADFEDDDPLNDINIHKQQVGQVPRGPRPDEPLDLADHQDAVQGARQQPLPFNQVGQAAANNNIEMEPLPPNPLRSKQPKVVTCAADVSAVESPWKLPDLSILNNPEDVKLLMLGDDTATLAKTIQDTLRSFRVDAEVKQEDISIGPTVIRFGIRPTGKPEMKVDEKGKQVPVRDAAGNIVYESRTRVSRIMALQNDLALVLEAKSIRMEAPVPGRPYVGVEIPNKNSRLVTLREVLESKEYQSAKVKSKLAIALGKDVAGAVRVGDLARMPHLLIAGATGAGKSVSINAIIASILTQATPDDVRMLMVDPKMVELNMYNGIPHLLSPVVTEVEKVVPLLKNGINEMERRYRLFSQLGVRNLDSYRKLRAEKLARGDNSLKNLPAIVIIIDELADLMMAAPEEVEGMICRLAQLARATGIHLVIATQRPSVDVITGLIKANIPTRISFMVSSAVDSRTIIDMGGAERLLGRGDMLYLPADAGRPERIQGAFLADDEAEKLVRYWRQQLLEHTAIANKPTDPTAVQAPVEPGWEISENVTDDFELDDDLLDRAEQVVREYERASISLLQRRLRIGYSRAARLIDLLEERGIIGHSEAGGRSREILDSASDRRSGGEGRTMADEVADIVAEEKAREEFLKKQAASGQPPAQGNGTQNGKDEGKK
jgi:DNA segregation ATPase FtsK/SpoIIIE-like protein